MDIKIIGSTHPGYMVEINEALMFSGKSAGICYLQDNFENILLESKEKTEKRVNMTLRNKHHSVFDHVSINLLLEGIPKILAMIINNEKQYTTSEKSARYTKMVVTGREKELYDKWLGIFKARILKIYPNIKEEKAEKVAMENARGLTSVFTPTTMEYTTTLRQLNYIMHWFNDFQNNQNCNKLEEKIKPYMKEFNEKLSKLYIEELNDDSKSRSISFFDNIKEHNEIFDEVYLTTYEASFAEVAQAQRHRTISYSISLLENDKYYIPKMIENDREMSNEWLNDISSLKENYPQSMLVKVCEKGTYDNFVLKCMERLCSNAQLEIAIQTQNTLEKYIEYTKNNNDYLYNILKKYNVGARCGFKGYKCTSPCIWGIKQGERLV